MKLFSIIIGVIIIAGVTAGCCVNQSCRAIVETQKNNANAVLYTDSLITGNGRSRLSR